MIDLVETWLPTATVRPDASLLPGEIRMVASSTTIDGTFADALRRLRAAFDADPTDELREASR
jgi:flagellar biosynthesis/type III secretory pathway protein FliH